jgi:FdhD protein
VAVTMRTPGHDVELAAGFLYSEGIISGKAQIESISQCLDEDGLPAPNIINIFPTERDLVDPRQWRRDFFAASSCGLCGKTSIESITRALPPSASNVTVTTDILYALGNKMTEAQEGFARSGGLHAAGLFDLEGNLLLLREDIGRHNAVDKIVGHALLHDMLPLDHHILLVSSRASFEIVQKAHAAGVPIIAVISAPSSLAVELAEQANMTLVAFLRENRLNVYAGRERIAET